MDLFVKFNDEEILLVYSLLGHHLHRQLGVHHLQLRVRWHGPLDNHSLLYILRLDVHLLSEVRYLTLFLKHMGGLIFHLRLEPPHFGLFMRKFSCSNKSVPDLVLYLCVICRVGVDLKELLIRSLVYFANQIHFDLLLV